MSQTYSGTQKKTIIHKIKCNTSMKVVCFSVKKHEGTMMLENWHASSAMASSVQNGSLAYSAGATKIIVEVSSNDKLSLSKVFNPPAAAGEVSGTGNTKITS